tara:strand:- start:355 stop:810 length:456 start_codon:yes stop_codon:yes gene_type:complete
MKNIILSLIIVSLISTGIAFGLSEFIDFWKIFTLSIVIQFAGSYIWKSRSIVYGEDAISEIADDLEELINRTLLEVECPCGKYKTIEPVFINEALVLECPDCKNKFSVLIDTKTALITEPLAPEDVYAQLQTANEEKGSTSVFETIKEQPT